MTFQEALKHLEKGPYAPCYLLSGEEPFLIRQLLHLFREKVVDAATRDFNYDLFRGEEADPKEVLFTVQTFPVMSPRRLVVIQNADLLKDDQNLLLDYLENPCETTVLVWVAAKPDMRKKIFTTLKKTGKIISCPPLYENEVAGWIAQAARQKGLTFSQEAGWYLKERLGKDLFLIHEEIEKIGLHCSGEKEVSLETVQEVVGGGRSHSIFELTRAVMEKNGPAALKILSSILWEGEHPLFILTMLTRQWRMMAVAKEALDAGSPEGSVGKKLPMPPSLHGPFFQHLRRWKMDEIRRAFDLSLAADSELKGGRRSPPFVMEALIIDLCRPTLPSGRRYTVPFPSGRR